MCVCMCVRVHVCVCVCAYVRAALPVVAGDDDVHSSAGLADVGGLLVVHLPQRVGEGPRGVDHTLGSHVKLLTCREGRGTRKGCHLKGQRSLPKGHRGHR